jgi:hypothetical protein
MHQLCGYIGQNVMSKKESSIGRKEMYLGTINELAPEVSARKMAESFWL